MIAFLEGISFIVLVFIAVPVKYYLGNPIGSKVVGPIHGALFVFFIFYAISVGSEQNWKLKTFGVVLLASIIPFGTFYIDHKILSKTNQQINRG